MAGEPITLGSESKALEALKVQVNDPGCPTLDLARALQSHLDTYPQSQGELAAKIGISRSFLNQVLALLKLPDGTLSNLKGKALKEWEIRKVLNSTPPDIPRPLNSHTTVDNSPLNSSHNNSSTGLNRPTTASNSPLNSYPLLRNTLNTFSRLVFFWVKEPGLGELAEQWAQQMQLTGWARVAGLVVLWGLAGYGGWHLVREIRVRIPNLLSPRYVASRGIGALTSRSGPKLTGQRWLSGHRLELRWNPTGPQDRYQIYWTSKDGKTMRAVAGADVKTPGAIVEIGQVWGKGLVSVTAINPQDEESGYSEAVEFDPQPVNDQDDVQPLPLQGASIAVIASDVKERSNPPAATGGSPQRSQRPLRDDILKPPSEVHADVRTPDLIRLSWRAVAKDVRYNVYSSASRTLTALRKENDSPLKSNTVDWTPETGLERYWIVVTSLDAQGHESIYSEAIEVVRHPEKSSSRGAEEAAGILRKVLPW